MQKAQEKDGYVSDFGPEDCFPLPSQEGSSQFGSLQTGDEAQQQLPTTCSCCTDLLNLKEQLSHVQNSSSRASDTDCPAQTDVETGSDDHWSAVSKVAEKSGRRTERTD